MSSTPSAEGSELFLPYLPVKFDDEAGLIAAVLGSIARSRPLQTPDRAIADAEHQLALATRTVRSLAYFAGATDSGFVESIDAYVQADDYGMRVIL